MVMMAGSETPKAKGSDSDLGPQASTSSESINYFSEFGILILRLGVSILMVHNGLEKLQNPEGFSEFVIGQHLDFLPGDPLLWTYAAALTEIICPIGIAFGLATRLCALGLLSTMALPLHTTYLILACKASPSPWSKTIAMPLNCLVFMQLLSFTCFVQGQGEFHWQQGTKPKQIQSE